MRTRTRTWLAGVAATTALGTLAGCGGGFAEQDVKAIQDAAAKDMKEITSVRMTGEVKQQGTTMAIDISASTKGSCEGTLSVDDSEAEIIAVDEQLYVKGNATFWETTTGSPQMGQQITKTVGDKWAKMPGGAASIGGMCDLDTLLEELDSKDAKKATKGEEGEVDGEEAIEIITKKDGESTSAWVATDDEHHILKLEMTSGETPGEFTFSEFDEELDVKAPAKGDVVDLATR